MKKSRFEWMGLLMVASCFLMYNSCAPRALTVADLGEVEVVSPCSGSKFQSSSKALRFSAIGQSREQMTAKKKALSEARAGLAATILTTVNGVTDQYVRTSHYENKERVTKQYESFIREVVNQNLFKAVIICERMTLTKRGHYKYYIALEQDNKALLQSIQLAMTDNALFRDVYDYDRFIRFFEAEVSKLGND